MSDPLPSINTPPAIPFPPIDAESVAKIARISQKLATFAQISKLISVVNAVFKLMNIQSPVATKSKEAADYCEAAIIYRESIQTKKAWNILVESKPSLGNLREHADFIDALASYAAVMRPALDVAIFFSKQIDEAYPEVSVGTLSIFQKADSHYSQIADKIQLLKKICGLLVAVDTLLNKPNLSTTKKIATLAQVGALTTAIAKQVMPDTSGDAKKILGLTSAFLGWFKVLALATE